MSRFAAMLLALSLTLALAWPGARAEDKGEQPTVRMVRGHVVTVDPARRLVLLKHDEIPSLGMPEMQMEYVVPEGTAFPDLTAGDKVRFAVVRSDGHYVITRVSTLPPARSSARRRGSQGAVGTDH